MNNTVIMPKIFYTGRNTYIKTYKGNTVTESEELELILDIEALILKCTTLN